MRKIVLFFVVMLLFLQSCTRKEKEIVLDKNDFSALSPVVKWAVVKEPYETLRSEPSIESEAAGYCRKGDVLQILGLRFGEDTRWFLVDGGYIKSDSVLIFANKYRATNESALLVK